MIEEAYVSFEVAKLLKEKGFDVPCIAYSYEDGTISYFSQPRLTDDGNKISLPTLAMTMRWLREVHYIFIDIYYGFYDTPVGFKIWNTHLGCRVDRIPEDVPNYDTYEDACEAAIKYCLKENLI